MILKNSIEATSMMDIGNSHARIAAGAMSFTSDKDAGNFVNGPLSITANLGNIRIGGVFKFNPLTMTGIPSTLVTPIPTFTIDVPAKHVGVLLKCAGVVMSAVRAIR
jgi:hypothetical protein